jgi:branched-chain amino acid aminotransferase
MLEKIWIKGELCDRHAASIAADAAGLLRGEGVFETLLAVAGRVLARERHLARLQIGAARMSLPPPDLASLRAGLRSITPAQHHRVRITYTRSHDGADLTIITQPIQPRPSIETAMLSPHRRNERSPLLGIKCTSYAENVLIHDEALRSGHGEALLLNTRDELCEGSMSNVFVVLDGQVFTPPLSSGCLPGVRRRMLLECCPWITERTILPTDLELATEVFLCSSLRGITALSAVDERLLPACNGSLTQEARAALDLMLASES